MMRATRPALVLAASFAVVAALAGPSASASDDLRHEASASVGVAENDPISTEDDPGTDAGLTVPVSEDGSDGAPSSRDPKVVELIPEVVEEGVPISVMSSTKCTANGDTCQILKGKGLKLDSWYSTTYQFPEDGKKCNILATFKYNVKSDNPKVWDIAKFSGCKTAPARGYIKWTTANVGSVTFSSKTHVNVSWTNGFGTTPVAEVHK